ncbi:MAG: hypothetical protein Q9183_007053, partial [Haloplaca sp. 2 TL-2023]
DTNTIDSQYRSTPPPRSIDLTPPPSVQVSKPAKITRMSERRESSLASPPPTCKLEPPITQGRRFGEVPDVENIKDMSEDQLRTLVSELLPALNDARTSANSSQIQHRFSTIYANEAAESAAVERDMTLHEAKILQDSSRGFGGSLTSPQSPSSFTQRSLDLALGRCRELQCEKDQLEHRMHAARKLIRQLSGKNEHLQEDNDRLRHRIKQNREHVNTMRSSGLISLNGTPNTNLATPVHHRTPKTPATGRSAHTLNTPSGSQGAFDALLLADQVLNEANSVPSTPTRTKVRKVNKPTHIRGAHSLSSLPSTPNRPRPMTADAALLTPTPQRTANSSATLSTPGRQITYPEPSPSQREDRDSTISASEDEGVEFVGASQASQRATEMLRRSAMSSKDNSPHSSQKTKAASSTRESENNTQSKMIGHVRKSRGADANERSEKRLASGGVYEDIGRGPKKAKMTGKDEKGGVGLGIERWVVMKA